MTPRWEITLTRIRRRAAAATGEMEAKHTHTDQPSQDDGPMKRVATCRHISCCRNKKSDKYVFTG